MAINYQLQPGETREAYRKRIEGERASNRPAGSLSGTMTEDKPDRVTGMTNFAGALNKAVSLARKQRQSADLDLLGKHIQPGSVSASTFTSLLSDINTASNSYSEPLVTEALDAAKVEEETRQSVRDLALELARGGANKETIDGILNAPDVDSAMSMAAGALTTLSNAEVRQVGSQLVTVDPKTGEVKVIYSAPEGGGGSSTGFFKSGGLSIPNTDIGEGAQMLAGTRGEDGFANTADYVGMYQHWVDNKGLPQDFFKNYDPDFYLNPVDATIPPYIRSQMKRNAEDDEWDKIPS